MSSASTSVANAFVTLTQVSRPASWIFGPILYTIGRIHSRSPLNPTISAVLCLLAQMFALSSPLCIIVFGVNDVFDYASDVQNPRKLADNLEGGVLAPQSHQLVLRSAVVSTFFIFVTFALTTRASPTSSNKAKPTVTTLSITTLLLLLSWSYSTPPIRLKSIPMVDSLSNGLIVLLTYLVGFSSSSESGLSFSEVPLCGKGGVLAPCTTGVHALGAVLDAEFDEKVGVRSVAVGLGQRGAAAFGAMCFLVAATSVCPISIIGAYVYVGLGIMLIPCINVDLAHVAFQGIVYWSATSAICWICWQAWKPVMKAKEVDQDVVKTQ